MAADNDVVGDLNQVVDLGALSNHRIANPAPIDRRSSSNLDIPFNGNNAELRQHVEMPRSGTPMMKPNPSLADADNPDG